VGCKTALLNTYILRRHADIHSAYYAIRRTWLALWLGGWLSVTRRYCIKRL